MATSNRNTRAELICQHEQKLKAFLISIFISLRHQDEKVACFKIEQKRRIPCMFLRRFECDTQIKPKGNNNNMSDDVFI